MLDGYSVNDAAVMRIEQDMRPYQKQLQICFHTYPSGANVIDMGVYARAGFRAAKLFTEIGLGCLGELRYTKVKLGGRYLPCAAVYVDHPNVAELSSHCAIWRVQHCGVEKNFSGPARAKAQDAYSAAVPYSDARAKKVVLAYQTHYLPSDGLVRLLAERAGVAPANLYLLVARTGTLTGAVQVAARNVEQTLPTLLDKGFPVECVVQAMGIAPILAVNDDENDAYGRVNDALIYGQETHLDVDCEDAAIEELLHKLTMDQPGNAPVYGIPFKEIFAQCENDWCKLPREWDAPSRVCFYNLRTGRSFVAGKHREDVLLRAFWGEKGCAVL